LLKGRANNKLKRQDAKEKRFAFACQQYVTFGVPSFSYVLLGGGRDLGAIWRDASRESCDLAAAAAEWEEFSREVSNGAHTPSCSRLTL
jgi:hypothetical protein